MWHGIYIEGTCTLPAFAQLVAVFTYHVTSPSSDAAISQITIHAEE